MAAVDRGRAELYARHRLPYADEAALAVLERVGKSQPTVADIGAGTGLLTRHFVGRAGRIHAVEPEPAMRAILERELGREICTCAEGVAEATGLPDGSIDLIVVGNAYHRFDPAATDVEFARVLVPGGWLALFSYQFHDQEYGQGYTELLTRFPEWKARLDATRHREPASRFFGKGKTETLVFRQSRSQTWEGYLGGVLGAMEAPDERDPWFGEFREAHRRLFDQCAVDGVWKLSYSTAVVVGQPRYE